MRVFVAGATGVIGKPLIPLLIAGGHEVVAMSRSDADADEITRVGARHLVADALDSAGVNRALVNARPDAVVNMLTAIPAELNPRRLAQDFELTNRLRTIGTQNLYEAAAEAGVERVIAQGLAYAYDPAGDGPAGEDGPLWQRPPAQFAPVLAALRELERLTAARDGLILRLGHLYGSGTIYAPDGSFIRQVQRGKVPLLGGGTAVFSFTHVEDAARAVVRALDTDVRGALNIVDDDPAPMDVWLPALAAIVGAKAPRPVPAFLGRLAVGAWGVAFMTQLRGASNARARADLDWAPLHGSWREGFAAELGGTGPHGTDGAPRSRP